MINKRVDNKWKNSILCVLIFGVAAVIGIGTGGKATETEEIQMMEWADETENELESESETETESESANESETETENELESESETEAENEPESESETETESESESESETEAESEPESESETETESEPESKNETETESEPESESETETESESESESETETESEPESESETEAESESESKNETETESEPVSESEMESENEPVSENETETESEPESESETEIENELVNESETETETEPVNENEEESEREWISETEFELESETIKEPIKEPQKKPEQKPELPQIYRGRDYEVTGDRNAYFRDTDGKLWIRSGTSIHIEPKNENVSDGTIGIQNLQEDGILSFSLHKKEKDNPEIGKSAIVKEHYYVDGEVPEADIQIDGNISDGTIFAAAGTNASVQIEPDAKSGMKKVLYRVVSCDSNGMMQEQLYNTFWQEWKQGQNILLTEEGTFQIFVRTEDQVGNIAFSGSKPVCIDGTPPVIEINGVMDQTANSGNLPIKVVCKDSGYVQGSLTVEIQGINGGKGPEVQTKHENKNGAEISFCDFPKEQIYDDVYRMTVSASDKAGNWSERVLEFSVNRYGSVYELSEPTLQEIEKYYISEGKDIVFYETNIDYIGESDVYVRHNGELKELQRGQDYNVTMSGSENTWKKYCYTVPADCFQEEGVYELLLASVDRADNTSDTGLQEQSVSFLLDYTMPEVFISGIEEDHVYEAETVTAAITPSDAGGVKYVRVYINGELEREYTGGKTEETIYHVLKGKPEWQNVQIKAMDMAGNVYQSDEISVLVNKEKLPANDDSSEDGVHAFSSDQVLLYTGIGAFIFAAIGCMIMKRRERK